MVLGYFTCTSISVQTPLHPVFMVWLSLDKQVFQVVEYLATRAIILEEEEFYPRNNLRPTSLSWRLSRAVSIRTGQ